MSFQCSISAKMLGLIDEETTKATRYGIKKFRTAVMGDTSAVMKMPLWENYITTFETGKSYSITNLHTSNLLSLCMPSLNLSFQTDLYYDIYILSPYVQTQLETVMSNLTVLNL